MRWNNLTIDDEERARLPGYSEDAVVRHFDAPEAISTRFYEVRAKSILNRVPEASAMPFRWTINPYRGCTHACAYCLGPETPVLLADTTTKPIADLEVGELILGTVVEGRYRRLRLTSVLDKWTSIKPAYVVALEDGSEIIASEDHRFLTDRGWKYVMGAEQGRLRRPHLTVGSKLLGTGGCVSPSPEDSQYQRGYLCGMIRGDAYLGRVSFCRSDGTTGVSRRFRLALADQEVKGFLAGAGLPEQLRFCIGTNPAISRKCSLDGKALKTGAALRVMEIRPLGMVMRMFDITTGTGDFIANGVVSHNCFARPTHTYLDFNAGRDFEREIVVKVNAPERLRAELARPSWRGEHVALGTNTDPYQWVEGRYRLMPGIWQAMIDARNPGSVLTKSPLLLRDLPLMRQLAERADFSAALSVPTIDEKAWRATEPHTPHPRARLEAVAELTRAGIRTGVLVAPLMPGINDDPRQVAKILELATEAGAAYIRGIALHLRGEVKGLFMEWLAEHRPDLLARYRELYRRGAYAPQSERRRLAGLVQGPDLAPSERGRAAYLRAARPVRAATEPTQEALFDISSEVKPPEDRSDR